MVIAMPPTPNKDDIQATYVAIASVRRHQLTPHRWSFLEVGVENIMRNLREGVDMQTVSALAIAVIRLLLILEL